MGVALVLSRISGLDVSNVTFLISQLIAVICSCLLRRKLSPSVATSKRRHLFEFVIGISILYISYGPGIIHLFLQAVPAYLMLVFLPISIAQYGILMFSLLYLSFVHIYILIGKNNPIDISAPLMVQTQKLSSLAFNMNDGVKIATGLSLTKDYHRLTAMTRRPRLLQLCGYLYCFHNCMIGPFTFFSDYLRFIEGNEEERFQNPEDRERFVAKKEEYRAGKTELRKQLQLLVIHAILFLWAARSFQVDYFLGEDFKKKNFLQKYIHLSIASFGFRQRFYFAWTLSCITSIAAGFGFSGFDSSGLPKYRFATNIHFLPIELGTSTKSIFDSWNTGTTSWLRECVYDRTPRKYAVWAVFAASAVWHGFHPGYYLAFISGAFITVTGRLCRTYLRPYFVGSSALHFIYDIITHIGAMFCLNYLGVTFMLQKTHKALLFWREMRFMGHLGPLALLIFLPLACGRPTEEPLKSVNVEQLPMESVPTPVHNHDMQLKKCN